MSGRRTQRPQGPLARGLERGLARLTGTALGLEAQVFASARGLSAHGDRRIVQPQDDARLGERSLRVGFFGNIANNAHNLVRGLRRLGLDAELIVEDGGHDSFLMHRPFWEELPVECDGYEDGLRHEADWTPPEYVRHVRYDRSLHRRYRNRYSAVREVQRLYRARFGKKIGRDRALVLAQQMGHWPALEALARYDVVQLSAETISLGPFCPVPHVVFPTGGDLVISPFEESLFGLLVRAGYRESAAVIYNMPNYAAELERLGVLARSHFVPFAVDTEVYRPGEGGQTRKRWEQRLGCARFLLCVCRQSWEWKGNDRMIRGFARFVADGTRDWGFVLMGWGPDRERSEALIRELGIESRVLWEPLCSKPLLRERQQAADVVIDNLVMDGYGTSTLESMAASTPVIARGAGKDPGPLTEAPPLLLARSDDDVRAALESVASDEALRAAGDRSLAWLRRRHGHEVLGPEYARCYRAASDPLASPAAL